MPSGWVKSRRVVPPWAMAACNTVLMASARRSQSARVSVVAARAGWLALANSEGALVHDVGFDGALFAAGLCVEAGAVEAVVQRFIAEVGKACRWTGRVDKGDVAEAARVVQAQFVAVIEGDGDVVVFFARAAGGGNTQRAAHAEVDV